ncbi:Translin [Linderina pennispora]|uniref:Translin n=1 Tax=Linderina pennispora TaxID=61395 RepID=A0A1Y1WGE6_9FUNG|nr:Translin [Linderina pennispora]ORX72418.1 Translin [Linderina pennispora]
MSETAEQIPQQHEQRPAKKPRFEKHKGTPDLSQPMSETKRAILTSFTQYRDTLDAHYDRRERVIKCSRDITALSKKIDSPDRVFADAESKQKQVLELFRKMSAELQGSNGYKYNRQATPGLQEYIEAIGLWTFLRDSTLITKQQVVESLSVADESGEVKPLLMVSDEDYILGVSDLPGEVNRYCINSIGKGDRNAVERSLAFLRELKEGINFVLCGGRIRDLDKKIPKIEKAYYSMSIRDDEMAKINPTAVAAAADA